MSSLLSASRQGKASFLRKYGHETNAEDEHSQCREIYQLPAEQTQIVTPGGGSDLPVALLLRGIVGQKHK